MKLSIAWIFDHIDANWQNQNIDEIIAKFNRTTAEVENYYTVNYDLTPFAMGKVIKASKNEVVLNVPEWKEELKLVFRNDAIKNQVFMVVKDQELPRWATYKDFALDKDGLLPAFNINEDNMDGGWRRLIETSDVILEVDNKSITHRPDMWGHRGFAREISAFMDFKLNSQELFLEDLEIKQVDLRHAPSDITPFNIDNQAEEQCLRFSGLYIPEIENNPSGLNMAFRLMRVGSKSINTLVDLTNYVMLDWSQPMHVFDADKITNRIINIRMSEKGEKLVLLDGREVELKDDLVIADAEKPMALAGVIGGLHDSLSAHTKSVFLESANFDPTTIRKTALKHKSRTEASARFEKTLDRNQVVEGIQRFIRLAKDLGIHFTAAEEVVVIGKPAEEKIITVSHDYLERRAGFILSEDNIIEPLQKLGFVASPVEGRYDITIPSFRGTKDVKAREDILEEVIRLYGFDKVTPKLPKFTKRATSLLDVTNTRKIKYFLKSVSMTEQQNYALYPEDFLSQINYEPISAVTLQNPISENLHRMVTSLIPGLLKNIKDNFIQSDTLNFFELGRTWSIVNNTVVERKSLAGIFFNKRISVDFYNCKNHLEGLLEGFTIDANWSKSGGADWYNKFESAEISIEDKVIGYAGKINAAFLGNLGVLPESDAFIFELDADFLLSYVPMIHKFSPISKFQEVTFDLSALVPLKVTVDSLINALKIDSIIQDVQLIDFFEKAEWKDQRSLAFRLRLVDHEKTLEKETIESIRSKAIKAIEKLGATLRV